MFKHETNLKAVTQCANPHREVKQPLANFQVLKILLEGTEVLLPEFHEEIVQTTAGITRWRYNNQTRSFMVEVVDDALLV